jgi:hypothetical protein
VQKAEDDWNAARQLNRVRKDPNYDGVCFHCQQSAEKYLKARLEEAGISFPKTHTSLNCWEWPSRSTRSGSLYTHLLLPSPLTPLAIATPD